MHAARAWSSRLSNAEPPSEPGHGQAFERLVGSANDSVGLLAYALYKRTIHERRLAGFKATPPADRYPSSTEIEVYRAQARGYLKTFADNVIEAERANIIEEALGKDRAALTAEIRRATSFWMNVLTGVIAWIISILLTILVVFAAPDWVTAWVRHLASR